MFNYRRHLISKPLRPFIMRVNSGADSQITIPTNGGGYNYDLRVQGGQVWTGLTGNHTINFPSANTDYFIEISGEFPTIYINTNLEKSQVLDIKQWGDIGWRSFERSFFGAENMTCSATDTPNLSNVTNMGYMFRNTTSLNVDIDFSDSYNNITLAAFTSGVHTINDVRLDCSSVFASGGIADHLQPFGPLNDSSNANIELHNLSVNIWFTNSNAAANLTSGVTYYNMILTFDHSASAIITLTTLQKSNLLSYLQANINPAYTTLQDWLTDIGSNWTIA